MAVGLLSLVMYIFVFALAIVGFTGQVLTLLMLHSLQKQLNKTLDRTTRLLMMTLATCDGFGCLILPLMPLHLFLGSHTFPFTLPGICAYMVAFICLSSVSFYLTLSIACVRFTAVFLRSWHTRLMASTASGRFVRFLLFSICSFPVTYFVIGYIVKWYTVRYSPPHGFCYPQPVDPQLESSRQGLKQAAILHLTAGILVPSFAGCTLYALLWTKLAYSSRKRRRTAPAATVRTMTVRTAGVSVTNTAATTTPTPNTTPIPRQTQQQRQYIAARTIAIASFVQTVLVLPNSTSLVLTVLTDGAFNPPFSGTLMLLYFLSFGITPLMYAVNSADMRRTYLALLKGRGRSNRVEDMTQTQQTLLLTQQHGVQSPQVPAFVVEINVLPARSAKTAAAATYDEN